MGNLKYQETTKKIIGCAMKIHSALGNGFQEVIYQRCLALEFKKNNLYYEREKDVNIFYDGHRVGIRRVDFLVEKKILIELKALINLEDAHLSQAINYLEAFNLETGLLINFGAKSLQFKRLFNGLKNKS